MFYIDQLIFFHNKHLQIHKSVDEIFDNLIKDKNHDNFKSAIDKI
jgi:hypothetical protein